jgi:hypothetical protein
LHTAIVLGAFADRVGIESAYGIVVPLLLAAVVLTLLAWRMGTSRAPFHRRDVRL